MDETPMAKGRTFDKLNAEQQIKFEERPLTVMVLEKATINEVRDMFLRLQNGTPLNAQQKRDAMGSYIGRVARDISIMPFFKVSVPFDNSGAAHHLVASQMLLLELKDKIVSCTSRQLDKIYEHYKKVSVDPTIVGKVKKIVGILGNIFSAKNHHLNRSYVLGFYWAISRILNIYTINGSEYQQIKENFEKLDDSRLVAMNRDYSNKTDDEIYFNLSLSMSRGTDGADGINTRHTILSQFLFDKVNLLAHPSLDPKRSFTHEEKLILFRRAQGCCQLEHSGKVCGRLIDFDDAVVDHIIPHSKNGLTVLENGRISYKSCNISRGNRDDFNPEVNCHLIEHNEPDGVTE
ncbi:MAG: HNH endonuclease [Deltaproteobacteria bacterium]|nr:HNH endonuclease [Deltaproteobacteria bacterium]